MLNAAWRGAGGVLGRERGRRRQSGVLQDNPFGRNKSFRFLRCFQFVPNFVVGKDRIVPNQVRHAKEPPSTKCLASSDSNGIRIGGFIVRRRQANDTFLAEPATMLLRHAGDLEDQFRGICVFVHRRCAFAEGTARRSVTRKNRRLHSRRRSAGRYHFPSMTMTSDGGAAESGAPSQRTRSPSSSGQGGASGAERFTGRMLPERRGARQPLRGPKTHFPHFPAISENPAPRGGPLRTKDHSQSHRA